MLDVRNALDELREESDPGRLVDIEGLRLTARKRNRHWAVVAIVLISTLVLAAGWFARARFTEAEGPPQSLPLTAYSGFESSATFSPDGNQLAFAWYRPKENLSQIYLKLIGAGESVRLTTGPADILPAWSPDGRWIGVPTVCSNRSLGAADYYGSRRGRTEACKPERRINRLVCGQ